LLLGLMLSRQEQKASHRAEGLIGPIDFIRRVLPAWRNRKVTTVLIEKTPTLERP